MPLGQTRKQEEVLTRYGYGLDFRQDKEGKSEALRGTARQSSSRSTRETFDYGPEEIGMSQLDDAPSTQQTQPRAQRQRRPTSRYNPGMDALGKGKTRSSKQ